MDAEAGGESRKLIYGSQRQTSLNHRGESWSGPHARICFCESRRRRSTCRRAQSDDDIGAAANLGFVDILVNNAGVAGYGNPVTMDFEDAVREMNVNYFGALRMTRVLAPAMIERGEGMIVNIATAFAKVNLPLVGTYCASKAALLSLGQALRAYLGDKGVHVMTVMPTTIDTDMSRGADVPKMTTDFVAGEILRHIREETIDPPIGEEAEKVLDGLRNDPVALEQMFAKIRA